MDEKEENSGSETSGKPMNDQEKEQEGNSKGNPTEDNISHHITSQEETLAFVTPYALNLNPRLFGKALAKPWKRLLAISIDGFILAVLSSLPFIIAIGIFIFAWFKRKPYQEEQNQLPLKIFIRAFIGLLFIVVVIIALVWYFVAKELDDPKKREFRGEEFVVQGMSIPREKIKKDPWMLRVIIGTVETNIKLKKCSDIDCWKEILIDLSAALPDLIEEEQGRSLIQAYVTNTELNESDKLQLENYLLANYGKVEESKELAKERESQSEIAGQQSLISWAKGILSDLGLGFGWAAVYFTVFTSLFSGRTPGKYVLGLQVVKIDNSPISLWDSFGRYGGYGAGLATGLLGFIQIYWDPNRQAIQDKIAATMVLDTKKPDWSS